MSSSARQVAFGEGTRAVSVPTVLGAMLFAGFLLRLLFINADGFHNDVAAFESWALTLSSHPLWQFYGTASFADYPPGYFYVLWIVGELYKLLVHSDPTYSTMRLFVKMPAILMDMVDAVLVFAIARRYVSAGWALAASALFTFNPAAIYVSAYWGQVDSVAGGFALAGLYSLARAHDAPPDERRAIVLGWLALAISVLMKPQAAIVGLLFLAFPFATADAAVRARRLVSTAIGFGLSLVLALVSAAVFHPTADVFGIFAWLLGRYSYGSSVYPFNTVNAFNLYAVFHHFWQPDVAPFTLGPLSLGPLYAWGIILILAAATLVVARYVQLRTDRAFLEASLLLALAFFCLATRMHERYMYEAFLIAIPLVVLGRRYLYASIVLSITLFANLAYSFAYQTVVEQKIAGVDATDVWPLVSHPASALNVAVFFVLGYTYLGGRLGDVGSVETRIWAAMRGWFSPLEGLTSMTRRDALLAGGFSLASLAICLAWYQYPAEKIFDEIYYARAGEEYLKHIDIFEFTHPPLTKLIITLSMLLFGGLSHAGDSGLGWRFLNIVLGALTVGVIYAFAKRLCGSTLFASIAAAMLVFDGFHFVQSRIATPEIGVSFFSLCVLYAFYRYWIASQVRVRPLVPERFGRSFALVAGIGLVFAITFTVFAVTVGPNTYGPEFRTYATVVAFAYAAGIVYLIARLWLPRRLAAVGTETSYGEGTRALAHGDALEVRTPAGQTLRPGGNARKPLGETIVDRLRLVYGRDGSLAYETPDGTATYAPAGTLEGAGERVTARDAWMWLGILAVAAGLLAASKWNGLFDFFVVWFIAAAVAGQRFLRRHALYGNPFGMPVDILIAAMGVVGGTIYLLTYIPYMTLGHNLVDIVALQHQMYEYHATLKATHPYQSQWWQWPFILRPISYYYHDFRSFAQSQAGVQCCVAEILALPNPLVWWLGLVSVPFAAYLGWREHSKGATLLVVAYFLQWLPWIGSPRIAFEYHFYPNLSIIVLANALLLQRVWRAPWKVGELPIAKFAVGGYIAAVVVAFAFFYPILAGVHLPYDDWHARMWLNSWI